MKKTILKSNGVKAATPADSLEKEDIQKLKDYFLSLDLSKPLEVEFCGSIPYEIREGIKKFIID